MKQTEVKMNKVSSAKFKYHRQISIKYSKIHILWNQIIFLEIHIENKLKEIFNNIFKEEINNLVMSLD